MTDKPPIQIYVKKIPNQFRFKMKSVYYLELLRPETMNLLRYIEEIITKGKKVGIAP